MLIWDWPPNVTAWSLPARMRGEPLASASATCTESIVSGAVPTRFDRWIRTRLPPRESRTVWRSVASRSLAAMPVSAGSASRCDEAQLALQLAVQAGAAVASAGTLSASNAVSERMSIERSPGWSVAVTRSAPLQPAYSAEGARGSR